MSVKKEEKLNALQQLIRDQNAKWRCPACDLFCEQSDLKCKACAEPKPGTEPEPEEKTATPSYTFGASNTSAFASNTTVATFSAGFSSSGGFTFGSPGGFSFGTATTFGSSEPAGFSFSAGGTSDDKENKSENRETPPVQTEISNPFTPSTTKKFNSFTFGGQGTITNEDIEPMDVDMKEREETQSTSQQDDDASDEDYATSDDEDIMNDLKGESFSSDKEKRRMHKTRKNDTRRARLKRDLEANLDRIPVGSSVVCATGDGSINGVLGLGGGDARNNSNFPIPIPNLYGKRIDSIATGAMSCAALTDENELYVWGSNEHGELTEDPLDIPDLGDEIELPVEEGRVLIRAEYMRRLTDIYNLHNPSNLDRLEQWMDNAGDNPHALYAKVCNKYHLEPEEEYRPRMPMARVMENRRRMINPSRFITDAVDEREFARRASCIYWTPARMRIPDHVRVCQVDFGAAHVAILDEEGSVYSMGTFNSDGLVGHHFDERANKLVLFERSFYRVNDLMPRSATPMDSMPPIERIACGANHFLMLDTRGSIWQMGVTQLGQRTSSRNAKMYLKPHTVKSVMYEGKRVKFRGIRVGDYHNMAISTEATGEQLFTWGQNNFLQCGHEAPKKSVINDVVDHPRPVSFGESIRVKDVQAGQHFTVVLDDRGRVWSFGRNACNQLGRRTQRPPRKQLAGRLIKQECLRDLPGIVPDLDEIDLISGGATFWFARSKHNHKKVVAFGFSNLGCCGVGNWHAASGRHVFDDSILPDDFAVTAICGSANHSLFLLEREDPNQPRMPSGAKRRGRSANVSQNDTEDESTSPGSPSSPGKRKKRSRGTMERESHSPPDMTSPPKKSQKTEGKRTASKPKKSRRRKRTKSTRSKN